VEAEAAKRTCRVRGYAGHADGHLLRRAITRSRGSTARSVPLGGSNLGASGTPAVRHAVNHGAHRNCRSPRRSAAPQGCASSRGAAKFALTTLAVCRGHTAIDHLRSTSPALGDRLGRGRPGSSGRPGRRWRSEGCRLDRALGWGVTQGLARRSRTTSCPPLGRRGNETSVLRPEHPCSARLAWRADRRRRGQGFGGVAR
jgi:hypothetical protein